MFTTADDLYLLYKCNLTLHKLKPRTHWYRYICKNWKGISYRSNTFSYLELPQKVAQLQPVTYSQQIVYGFNLP